MTSGNVSRDGERGMILVVVLWTVALMTVVAVALAAYVQGNLSASATDLRQLRSELVLRSGINAAAAVILAMSEDERQFLAGDRRLLDLGGGREVEVTLSEATGRLDLNLAKADFITGLFNSALGSVQAGTALAGAVIDLRNRLVPQAAEPGKDDGKVGGKAPRSVGAAASAPKPEADPKKPPQIPPVFQSPLQLLGLRGVEPATIGMLSGLVGVLSRDGKINPLSAPEAVLRAVPKLNDADLAAIMGARRRHDRASGPVAAVIKAYPDYMSAEPSRAFIVTVRIIAGSGLIARSAASADILLTPDAAKPFQLIALSW